MDFRALACWDYGFESCRGHGYLPLSLSLVSVEICQVQVFSMGWSLFQGRPVKSGRSECDCDASSVMRPWHTSGCEAMEKMGFNRVCYQMIRNYLEANHVKERFKTFWMFFQEKQLSYFQFSFDILFYKHRTWRTDGRAKEHCELCVCVCVCVYAL